MIQLSRIAGIALVLLTATACFSYRGTRGVELNRVEGIKLGPLSMRFVASLSDDDGQAEFDFHDLTSVGVAVFERGAQTGSHPRRIEPKDLRLNGYTTMLSSSDGDEQVLILVKPRGASISDMVLLSVDADEVVVARLTGHLDKLLAKAIDDAKAVGGHGARGVVPLAN